MPPPTISAVTTSHDNKPSPATDRPNARPATPSPARTSPTTSKRSGFSLLIGSMYFSASQMPSSPIGMLIRKIQCHEK